MMRGMTILWGGLAVVIGIGLFLLKYEVQSLEDHLRQVNKDIRAHQEAVHVLRAEWAFLNDPDRLRDLNERHLGMTAFRTEQLVSIADLPFADPHRAPLPESAPEAEGRVMVQAPPVPAPPKTRAIKPEAPTVTASAPTYIPAPSKPLVASKPEPVRSEALQSAFATAKGARPAAAAPKPAPVAARPAPAAPAQAPAPVRAPAPVAPVVTSAPGADVFVIKSPALIAAEQAAGGRR